MKVQTSVGLVERELLEVEDIIAENADARTVKTVWRLKGVEVRSDLHVMMLRGLASDLTKGNLDGQ